MLVNSKLQYELKLVDLKSDLNGLTQVSEPQYLVIKGHDEIFLATCNVFLLLRDVNS